jgi:carbonic anhydrase
MDTLQSLLEGNRRWAAKARNEHPVFFEQLAEKQSPEILLIGCSDSRVPPSVILDQPPGRLFVHRNIANVISDRDINGLSVIQYAVDVLKVKHIIVCGHYGCGGVMAALEGAGQGAIGCWLDSVRAVYRRYQESLDRVDDRARRQDRLCELNVIEQVAGVCRTDIVGEAWKRRQHLQVHGWIYRLKDGTISDLKVSVSGPGDQRVR